MKRGDLYRVSHPERDPKRARVFVVVSRQVLIDSSFSTVVCAPVYSQRKGLSTEVYVGPEDGLKHTSSIHCDALVSISKAALTHYVATLSPSQDKALAEALRIALALE